MTARVEVPRLPPNVPVLHRPPAPPFAAGAVRLIEPSSLPTRRPTSVVTVFRALWLLAAVIVPVGSLIDLRLSIVAFVVATVALMVWSGLAAVNVRRARPRTVYAAPPSATVAMLSWFVPLAAWGAASAISSDAEQFSITWFGDYAVALVALIVGSLVPLAVMARLAGWAGDRPGRWWEWLWLPLLSVVLSWMLLQLLRVPIGDAIADGRFTVGGEGIRAVAAAVAVLPLVVHLTLGWRAMQGLEAAARMSWERRAYPEGSLDLTSELAQRLATARYLETRQPGVRPGE